MTDVILVDVTNGTEKQMNSNSLPDGAISTGRHLNGFPEYVIGYPEDVEKFLKDEDITHG